MEPNDAYKLCFVHETKLALEIHIHRAQHNLDVIQSFICRLLQHILWFKDEDERVTFCLKCNMKHEASPRVTDSSAVSILCKTGSTKSNEESLSTHWQQLHP